MSSFACLEVSDIIFCLLGVIRHHLLPAWDILMPSFAHSEYSDVISEECSWSYMVTIVVVIHTYVPFYMLWAKMI